MRIGVYGGSFNPIHFGHLIPISSIIEQANIDRLEFVVANTPPHKNSNQLALGKHRLEMTKLAIAGDDRFSVSDIEFNQDQKPYTIDLLASYKKLYPSDEIILIIGADSLFDLKNWYKWEILFERADEIIAMARHGFPKDTIDNVVISRVKLYNTPIIEISATEIRNRILDKKSVKYWLPASVESYICRNSLYTV